MRKLLLLLLGCTVICVQLLAQESRPVSGKVLDDKGAPVPNATVVVKGTTIGTTTAGDGTFHLTIPATAKSLEVSAVGMTKMEISLGTKSEFNIALLPEDKSMKEVIVVGYGTQKKSEITSSLTKVGGDKIANVPLTSLDQMLQGKAAGLQSITFSGQPGANQAIRIRGIGSISASAQPLFVIDGVQINSGDLSRLSTTSNVLANW